MKPLTREFMRGKLDSLAFGAKTAQGLFEEYISLQGQGPAMKSCGDKLRIVVRELGRSYANVTNSLEGALREDEG
jgi:hypothetical protein